MKFHAHTLASILQNEGLLPPDCRVLDVIIPADGALALRYEVFLDEKQLRAMANAFTTMADHAAERARAMAERRGPVAVETLDTARTGGPDA